MFRRPLRAENPWWDIEDASIWSSSTRWDSKPRGGHSESRETLDHSYLKACKSYDNSTDSFLWAVVFQTLTNYLSFFFFFFNHLCWTNAEAGANSSSEPKKPETPAGNQNHCGGRTCRLWHLLLSAQGLLTELTENPEETVCFCSDYNVICGCFPEILTLWLGIRNRLLSLLLLLLFPHLP